MASISRPLDNVQHSSGLFGHNISFFELAQSLSDKHNVCAQSNANRWPSAWYFYYWQANKAEWGIYQEASNVSLMNDSLRVNG